MISSSPTLKIRPRSVKLLARMIASTVVPYCWAIRASVSPCATRCVRRAPGGGSGDGAAPVITTVPGVPRSTPCGLGNAAGLAAGTGTGEETVGPATTGTEVGGPLRLLVPALSHELTAYS